MTSHEYAIIVAGGKGTRFGGSIPKQFLELKGKPLLLYTLEAFCRYSPDISIILVLPQAEISLWEKISQRCSFDRPITVVPGGDSRFQSVRNGLSATGDTGYAAIHDGVRPLVTTEIISTSFRLAREHGSAVAAVALKESLRVIRNSSGSVITETEAINRTSYRLVQTPQTFEIALLKEAYRRPEDPALTDDASVVEKAGHTIFLFEGDYRNIKITNREDLRVAEALMSESPIL